MSRVHGAGIYYARTTALLPCRDKCENLRTAIKDVEDSLEDAQDTLSYKRRELRKPGQCPIYRQLWRVDIEIALETIEKGSKELPRLKAQLAAAEAEMQKAIRRLLLDD